MQIKTMENSKWISVNDKLPKDTETVLIANIHKNWVDVGQFIEPDAWFYHNDEIKPTHWMPLPKIPNKI